MGKWAERKPERTKKINELRVTNTTIVVLHAAHHVKKRINVTSSRLLIREDIPGQSSYIKTSTWKFWRTFAHLLPGRNVLITLLISKLHIF